MFKVVATSVPCFFVSILSISCDSGRDRGKYVGKDIVSALGVQESKVDSMSNIFGFPWEVMCFEGISPTTIRFYGESSEELEVVELDPEEVLIREDYVPGSPAGKCFEKHQKVRLTKESVRYKPVVFITILENEE